MIGRRRIGAGAESGGAELSYGRERREQYEPGAATTENLHNLSRVNIRS